MPPDGRIRSTSSALRRSTGLRFPEWRGRPVPDSTIIYQAMIAQSARLHGIDEQAVIRDAALVLRANRVPGEEDFLERIQRVYESLEKAGLLELRESLESELILARRLPLLLN